MMLDDPLVVWGRQGDRVWQCGDAIALACPNLSRRDRLIVQGSPRAVAGLIREVLPEIGRGYRPIGDEALISAVAAEVPGMTVAGRFAWMDTTRPASQPGRGAWLDRTDGVAELLDVAFPGSYAWPGGTGVLRWAGIAGDRLLATAAEAWSVPEIGFLAGVATHPAARHRGLATAICAFVTRELLAGHDRVALFADYWNRAAMATYARLGFALRPLAAARFDG